MTTQKDSAADVLHQNDLDQALLAIMAIKTKTQRVGVEVDLSPELHILSTLRDHLLEAGANDERKEPTHMEPTVRSSEQRDAEREQLDEHAKLLDAEQKRADAEDKEEARADRTEARRSSGPKDGPRRP